MTAVVEVAAIEERPDWLDDSVVHKNNETSATQEQSPVKWSLANGLTFDHAEDILQALGAALEVNQHLKEEVERRGGEAQELRAQLAACEHRYAVLAERVKAENLHDDPEVERHIAVTDRRMDAMVADSLRDGESEVWELDSVRRRRAALLERGAQQGWLMQPSALHFCGLIGTGTFGQTYEALWCGARVAVKRTRAPQSASEAINFFREVECLAAVKHPNILPFLGACLSDAEHCLLVTEFMPGGTVKDWLYGPGGTGGRRPHRRLVDRVAMALQVAQGMAALEALDPPVVHRDLKPSNVFVDGGGGARVADMNLSLRLHEDSLATLTGETGTYLYMSPEMMRHELYTTKTDVWSFGVMLVELCNAALPYSSLYLTPLQVAIGVADRHLAPAIEVAVPESLRRLAAMCLNEQPMLRPHFAQIVPQLRAVALGLAKEARAAAQGPTLFGRVQGMLSGAAHGLHEKAASFRERDGAGSSGGGQASPPAPQRESHDGSAPQAHRQPQPTQRPPRPVQRAGTAPGAHDHPAPQPHPAHHPPPTRTPATMFSGFLGRVRQQF